MRFAAIPRSRSALLITALSISLLFVAPATSGASMAAGPGYASDQLLVKFRPSAGRADVARALMSAHASDKSVIRDLGVHVVHVSPSRLESALSSLRHSPNVLYAEHDGVVQDADVIPNDPLWPSEASQVHLRTPQAWDYSTGSPGVVIAILDTGVDPTTPDLQGAFVAGYDFVNNDADPSDDHGHGTMAAGVAAARGNNALGIAGYCWTCSIMPVKVLGADGSELQSTLATGITWATDHGARVINMSVYGGAYSTLASAVS